MRRLRLISLAVAVAAACFAASPAAGYKTGGKRWPGTSVRYYNASPQNAAAVQDAVRAWNASGVRVRFVPTTRKRAQIIIRTGPRGCSGFAQIGSQGRFGVQVGSGCERRFMALIAAHELGHVLGLSHEMGRCATMNPTILNWVGDRCKQVRGDPWQYRCRLLERDDVRGAIRLYGGSVNPKAVGVAWCDRFAPLTPPGEVQATATLTTINLRWRDLASRNLSNTDAAVRQGDCATLPVSTADHLSAFISGDVTPGKIRTAAIDVAGPGPNCVEMWSVDRFGRPSPVPVRVTVTVPVPITPTANFTFTPADGSVTSLTSTIAFAATATDADSPVLTYSWDFGDFDSGAGPTPSHTYTFDGTFVVTLTVTDEGGRAATVSQSVVIAP